MDGRRVRVLVVDDSLVVRDYLAHILGADPGMEVVGFASNGKQAVERNLELEPDVITMDIHMPVMDGVEATRQIMQQRPVPIVVVSVDFDPSDLKGAFSAMKAGAVHSIRKPRNPGHPEASADQQALCEAVRAMSEVRVVRRRPPRSPAPPHTGPSSRSTSSIASIAGHPTSSAGSSRGASLGSKSRPRRPTRLAAIGASTGGPPVIERLLRQIPTDLGYPIVIVQHIAAGFLPGMVRWLDQQLPIPVRIAKNSQLLEPGSVYFAPEDAHLSLSPFGRTRLHPGSPPEHKNRPSVSWLFRSVAEVVGPAAVGVLLTGMGEDGSAELGLIREQGGLTLAQDQASSAVWGMPGRAVELGSVDLQLDPEAIGALMARLPTPYRP
jgi:two-component system chemotaxis response regulator CheB